MAVQYGFQKFLKQIFMSKIKAGIIFSCIKSKPIWIKVATSTPTVTPLPSTPTTPAASATNEEKTSRSGRVIKPKKFEDEKESENQKNAMVIFPFPYFHILKAISFAFEGNTVLKVGDVRMFWQETWTEQGLSFNSEPADRESKNQSWLF